MKGKTHDLNHYLTFSAHTINCVCHSIRSMFRVLFEGNIKLSRFSFLFVFLTHFLKIPQQVSPLSSLLVLLLVPAEWPRRTVLSGKTKFHDYKSVNLQYNTLGRLDDWANESPKILMYLIIKFFSWN